MPLTDELLPDYVETGKLTADPGQRENHVYYPPTDEVFHVSPDTYHEFIHSGRKGKTPAPPPLPVQDISKSPEYMALLAANAKLQADNDTLHNKLTADDKLNNEEQKAKDDQDKAKNPPPPATPPANPPVTKPNA